MKSQTENIRHHALKFQQLIAKGWCKETAATVPSGVPKFSIEDYHKTERPCSYKTSQTYIYCYGAIHSFSYTGEPC